MPEFQYGSHPRQRIWILDPSKRGGQWLVVIHGGIWSAASVTEQNGIFLASSLANQFTGVASIDYRLSPEVIHPQHLEDSISAVGELAKLQAVESVVLAGHSAGAFIAGQIATRRLASPTIPIPPIAHTITIEGLYDLVDLIEEYPSYRHYIETAFGDDESVWKSAQPDWVKIRPLLRIHSKQDELVSLRQPTLGFLDGGDSALIVLEQGGHDPIFESIDLSSHIVPVLEMN